MIFGASISIIKSQKASNKSEMIFGASISIIKSQKASNKSEMIFGASISIIKSQKASNKSEMIPILKSFMNNYIPDYEIENFNELTESFLDYLKDSDIKAIMLDIDGTITTYHGIEITKDAEHFLKLAREKEFIIGYITNCSHKRYNDVIAHFGKYITNTDNTHNIFYPYYDPIGNYNLKPFKTAFKTPANRLNINTDKWVFIGDQYSTDILGAKNAGVNKTIKITSNLSSNEPRIKRYQRFVETAIYKQILKHTKKQPKKIGL
ncbi:MAG: HAD hydrolase-like protein [DPANN group archaeon]|nr:HAD hydrolase-like protein [DPANN group archaeon]